MDNKNAIKKCKDLKLEIDTHETKQSEVVEKKTKSEQEVIIRQREFDRAAVAKETALDRFAKGVITEADLDAARLSFATAEDALRKSREILSALDVLLWDLGQKLAQLAEQHRDAEKAVWDMIFDDLQREIMHSVGDKVRCAITALTFSGRLGPYGTGHELEHLFGPAWERERMQSWAKQRLAEIYRMKA